MAGAHENLSLGVPQGSTSPAVPLPLEWMCGDARTAYSRDATVSRLGTKFRMETWKELRVRLLLVSRKVSRGRPQGLHHHCCGERQYAMPLLVL